MDEIDVIARIAKRAQPRQKEGTILSVHPTTVVVQPRGSTRTIICAYNGDTSGLVGKRCVYLWVQPSKKYVVSSIFNAPATVDLTKAAGSSQRRDHLIHDNVGGEFISPIEKATPVDDDLLLIEDSADLFRKKRVRIADLSLGGGGFYQTVQDNGVDQTQRSKLNFIGTTIADNPGNDSTDVTVTGGGVGGGSSTDFILIREEQTSATAGGTFTSGAWRTRVLNTLVTNEGAHASLSSNQVTLDAGTYRIRASAPAFYVGGHQARWQNVTDSVTTIVGSSAYSEASTVDGITTVSLIDGTFTIASPKVFELQHAAQSTKATNGFGAAVGAGINEVYSIVEIECVVSGGGGSVKTRGVYTRIFRQKVTGSPVAGFDTGVVDLSAYEHLRISLTRARSTKAAISGDSVQVAFNGDTTAANYLTLIVYGGTASGSALLNNNRTIGDIPATTATADYVGDIEWIVAEPGVSGNGFKNIVTTMLVSARSTGEGYLEEFSSTWRDTSAITEIALSLAGGDNFTVGTVFEVYGFKNEQLGGGSASSPALIYDYTLPADGTFDTNTADDLGNTGISQLYTDLELRVSGISAAGVTGGVEIFFNGDTNTAHYDGGRSLVNGGSSGGDLNEIGFVGTSGVGSYGSIIADIPGYAIASIHRTLIARSAVDGGGTSPNFWQYACQHNQAGALTRFQAHCRSAGNFAAGSRLRIYGIP